MQDNKKLETYLVYAKQSTTFCAEVLAHSASEANKMAEDDSELDWDEIGELEWELLPDLTDTL